MSELEHGEVSLERLRQIKGSIADAIRERVQPISDAIASLNDHLKDCRECNANETPYKLCPTGNRLFNAVLDA